MSEFNLDKVLALLENANEQGIDVSFANEELSLRFQKGGKIDKAILDELKLNKPALIHYFKTHTTKGSQLSLPPIQKRVSEDGNGIRLSFSQERLWFIDQLEGSLQYHIPSVLHLRGKLNTDALANAIQQIVNRHEVLRTVIREENGQPFQFITERDNWHLEIVDGSGFVDNKNILPDQIQQSINQPFDLSKDSMIRAQLFRLNEQYHVLVVTLHHIAADGWSASIIVRELLELYNAFEKGSMPNLPELPIQYADYAVWQRQYLQGEVLDKSLAWWKDKLKELTPLQLPLDYPRPVIQSSRGAVVSFMIDKELSDRLQLMSRQNGATIFMTMLAAFNVLLKRYTGQDDICVGTPIAGRDQPETESLIGFFINSLALRNDLAGDPSFTQLLQQVKSNTLEAFENKQLPFEKVVDAVVTERSLGISPVFQVMFALQNQPTIPELKLGEVTMEEGSFENATAKFDLSFFLTVGSPGTELEFAL